MDKKLHNEFVQKVDQMNNCSLGDALTPKVDLSEVEWKDGHISTGEIIVSTPARAGHPALEMRRPLAEINTQEDIEVMLAELLSCFLAEDADGSKNSRR